MKILAICGSPRKGNSIKALEVIRDSFPGIDFEILHLKDLEFNFCKGCYSCVLRGEALKYMDKMLSIFGFNLAPSLELQIHPGKVHEKTVARNREKGIAAMEALVKKIEKGEQDDPSIGLMVPFLLFKYVSKLDKNLMPADYNYYKDKGDYFYDAKIPFYKKFIAKRVSDKIISQFD